jgi:cytoskeletal protein CcmA (bactofilin family)
MALFGNDKRDPLSGALPSEEKYVSARTGELHTLLGKGSEFDGKLSFEGQVRIDGKYTGQINTKDVLVIGESARVNAEINAGTVIINGTVEGVIRATQIVELHPPARVKGTIETPAMSMEKGVIFEGTTKMGDAFKTAAPPPAPGTK